MRSISSPPAGSTSAQARRIRELLVALSRRRSLRDPIAGSCQELDLTPVQVHAVLWLGNDGALTMGELARRVAITEKTITGIVDRLERDGLARRERDPADRRVVRVRLAPPGEALWRRVDAGLTARLEAVLALLDLRDRRDLVRILQKLESRLAGGAPARRSPQPLPRGRVRRAPRPRSTNQPARPEDT